MSFDPIGYTFSGGYALCADCCTDDTDTNNETGKAGTVFNWEDATLELTCDKCGQTLLEGAGYIGTS
jgi:hypothetical protein